MFNCDGLHENVGVFQDLLINHVVSFAKAYREFTCEQKSAPGQAYR